jgi:hypothetical protein
MPSFWAGFSSLFLSLPCDVSTDSARGGSNGIITFSISYILHRRKVGLYWLKIGIPAQLPIWQPEGPCVGGGTDPNGCQIGTSAGMPISSHNTYLESIQFTIELFWILITKRRFRECSPIKFQLLSAALCPAHWEPLPMCWRSEWEGCRRRVQFSRHHCSAG